MATMNRKEAHALVNALRKKNGGLSPEQRERLHPEDRETIENLREQLGGSVQSLATNLYSTDTRFVFELIQNAEDNSYAKARAANKAPFLSFTIHPDKIVVDCNEDGFTEANVRAICSITKSGKIVSSKTEEQRQQGYIGEKGIGFKSVFKVASKVHIQSEPFSFYFEYNRESETETGMGMITPYFLEHKDLPNGIRTRMTLTLAPTVEFDNLVKHFSDPDHLPDSLLIFLSQINRLTITIHHEAGLKSDTTYSYQYKANDQKGVLTKHTLHSSPKETYYHVQRKRLENLPKDPARENKSWAEVILAFPIDSVSMPVVEQQHVFAYLPMRKVGFSFLIQSDFVTQASREDLANSPRNEALLDGVAETFRDAVLHFCDHPSLRFHWMAYLPSESISQSFWAKLLPKILKLLKDTPILLSRSGKCWKCPGQLKRLTHDALDDDQKPLFDDLPKELYLSSGYNSCEQAAFTMLGIQHVNVEELLERVKADLTNTNSKIKSPLTSKSWHTRSADLLLTPFEKNWSRSSQLIKDLSLIPLRNGSWVSSTIGQVFYPEDNSVPVPTDLGLRLVDPRALEVPSRKALFSKLGVRTPKSEEVNKLIVGKYDRFNAVDLCHSIEHLRYMFWKPRKDQKTLDRTIYVKDHANRPVYRAFLTFGKEELIVDDLYFESDDVYGPAKLLTKLKMGEDIIAPGFPVHFINEDYLKAVSSTARQNDISWKDWLANFAEIRRIPRLASRRDFTKLSEVFSYILEKRRDKIVGTLKAHWSSYSQLMNEEILRTLSETHVPCDGTAETSLAKSYFPLSKLKKSCARLGVEAAVPFLKLPTELNENSLGEWDFLKALHVRYTADLDFYIHILRHLRASAGTLSKQEEDCLFTVYEKIERHSRGDDYPQLRVIFAETTAIYVPPKGSRKAHWVAPEHCVWEAPDYLDVRHSLASAGNYHENDRLKHLFNAILEIHNAGWNEDVLQVIDEKQRQTPDVKLSTIYKHIFDESPDEDSWELISKRFEEDALIYIPQDESWLPPSLCLWAMESHIQNKAAIARHYQGLEKFFVNRILVHKPNIPLLVEAVLVVANQKTPQIQEIKDLIKELNSFGPHAPDLDRLNGAPILPVKGTDGVIRLVKATDAFAIVDRVHYLELFADKIPVMDYSREETHRLEAFFSALGLEQRYMSRLVRELSMVNGASNDVALSAEMRRKAYSIFRYAAHYRVADPQDRSLYDRFRDIEVCVSDEIVKTVTISLEDLNPVTIEGEKATLHVEEINNHLKLFVPHEKRDRELCFLKHLPDRLAAYLGIQNPEAVKVLGDLLKSSACVLDQLLDEHGIVQLPWSEPAQQNASSHESWENDEEIVGQSRLVLAARPPSNSRGTTPERGRDTIQRISDSTPRPGSRASSAYDTETNSSYGRSSFTPATLSFTSSLNTPTSSLTPARASVRLEATPIQPIATAEYIALLNYVIAAAAATAMQTLGLPPLAEQCEPIELSDTTFGRRSDNQIAHDIKIGAAGELYVFEFLLNLGLPNFSRRNWKSNVRREVCVHEKYRDMEDWRGPETADIVYEDCGPDHKLTGFLSRHLLPGYSICQGANIKCYLEVKTTIGDCSNKFFLSKAQYRRMENMALKREIPATELYVIMRVYNLGKRNMTIQYYVDPMSWKTNGDLIIEAESYTVTEAL